MEDQQGQKKRGLSRRSMLRSMFTGAFAAGAGLFGVNQAAASAGNVRIEKRVGGIELFTNQPLISQYTSHNNFVFVKGMGDHEERDIKVATSNVLDMIERELENSGSSMEHALKVTVFLHNLRHYDGMNEAYRGRFGDNPPARSTVACYRGIPGGSLIEVDCIAALP